MFTGQIIGIIIISILIIIQLYWNYINLFNWVDSKGKKPKHYVCTYIFSWFVAIIPIAGLVFNLLMTIPMLLVNYKCTSFLFNKK